LSGVIVSGSPAYLSERAPWMLRGLAYLRELALQQTPTLGICFGHQMLAEALGGRVGRNPRGREIGTVGLRLHRESPLFGDIPAVAVEDAAGKESPLTANASHLDSVLELPTGAQVVASSELEPHAALQFGPRAWGVQFHPEFDEQITRCYLTERREAIQAEGLDTDQLLSRASDAPVGRGALRRFIQNVVL
jgi:GMP synthase (glutamine-hydrolysing)